MQLKLDIYQILRLNYYKKLKEWWTDDVDRDCIRFNLYRKYCKIYLQDFHLEEITQIECSISKKNKRTEEPWKQKLKKRNIILITVLNSMQIQNLDLSENFLIDYSFLHKTSNCLYYNIPKRKQVYSLVTSFFTG